MLVSVKCESGNTVADQGNEFAVTGAVAGVKVENAAQPMTRALRRPILAVLAAIAITTTMVATGSSAFSALPLLPLLGLFWYLQRLSLAEVGSRGANGATAVWPCHIRCVSWG